MDSVKLNEIAKEKWGKELNDMTPADLYGLASQLENENPEAAKQFRAMYNSAKQKDKSDNQSEKETISDDMFVKNVLELNKLSTQHKVSPDIQKAIDSLEVVDDNGNVHDVRQEIIETAKVSVALDMVTSKKVSKEEYDAKFDAEVNHILSTILTTSASLKGDENNVQIAKDVQENIRRLYNGNKVKVTDRSFMSSISAHLSVAEKKANALSAQFKDKGINFFNSVNEKIKNVDNKLTNKFGKVYTTIRNSAKNIALYSGASLIGIPGIAAFAAYQGYTRCKPIIDEYKKEKDAGQVTNYVDYSKKHPDKLVMAGLYTISAVAGAMASFLPGDGITYLKMGAAMAGGLVAPTYKAIKDGLNKDTAKSLGWSLGIAGVSLLAVEGVKYFSGASDVDTNTETEVKVTEQTQNNTIIPAVQGAVQEPVDIENERISDPTPAQQETSETTKGQSEVQAESQNYTPDPKVQQNIYVKNFNLLPEDAQTLIKAYDVKNLPNGMTIEMAANLARVNYLYYGEDDGLKILYGCEETKEINSKEYFANLTTKFHTKPGDNILIGFPTEEGYQADPNIHARITKIDCEKVTIDRNIKGPEKELDDDVQEDNPVQKRRPEPKGPDQLPAKQPVLKATPAPKALDPIQSNVEIQNQDWTHVNPRTGEGTEGLLNIELKGTPVENAGATGGGIHAQHNADMIANNPELQEAEIKDGKLVDKSGKAINQGWTKMGERTQVETSTDGDATSSTGDASTSTKENETTTLKSPIKKPLTYQEQLIMNAYNQILGKGN